MTEQQIAAMRQALEALEQWNTPLYKRGAAITALTAALEQPAQQEPVAYSNRVIGGKKWLSIHASKGASDKWLEYRRKEQAQGEQYEQVPLYTRPQAPEPVIDKSAAIRIATALGWEPKREWVWLTDMEREKLRYEADEADAGYTKLIKATEAKLREKNA